MVEKVAKNNAKSDVKNMCKDRYILLKNVN